MPNLDLPKHLEPLAALLARAESEPVRAVVSLPPQFGMTSMFSRWLSAYLKAHPDGSAGYATYSRDQADAVAERPMSRVWRFGVGDHVGGIRFDQFVLDAPTKTMAEACAKEHIDRIVDWTNCVVMPRLTRGASFIVGTPRYDWEDIFSRLAARRGWEALNIPACDAEGHSVWPERFPDEHLERLQREDYWQALYLGRPPTHTTTPSTSSAPS